MDENKHPQQPQASKEIQASKENQKGNQTPAKQVVPTANRKIFAKRWVYPAIYLGAAALIIGLMYIKSQSGGSTPTTSTGVDNVPSGNTAVSSEFQWPVADATQTKVSLGFFSDKASAKEQAASLVFYDNTYYPHTGYDIQASNQQPFTVVSAVDGKVTSVTPNPVYGLTVEVTTNDGYVVHYESLNDAKVKAGDKVTQGQAIGTSGTCAFEKSQGNHLYFEVLKNGNPVDPGTLLPKA
jgi:stage II sporulation protein Q